MVPSRFDKFDFTKKTFNCWFKNEVFDSFLPDNSLNITVLSLHSSGFPVKNSNTSNTLLIQLFFAGRCQPKCDHTLILYSLFQMSKIFSDLDITCSTVFAIFHFFSLSAVLFQPQKLRRWDYLVFSWDLSWVRWTLSQNRWQTKLS